MIVNVTPIGDLSGTMTPVEVAVRVSEYLAGVGLTRAGRVAGAVLELPSLNGDGPVRYYADSSGLRPGRWLGERSGDVEPGELIDLIAGVDPDSGERIDAQRQARAASDASAMSPASTTSRSGTRASKQLKSSERASSTCSASSPGRRTNWPPRTTVRPKHAPAGATACASPSRRRWPPARS
jgi:hypothetical protein